MGQKMDIPPAGDLKRVIVVGGGFAGLTFCQKLKDDRYQIILIDKTNHHNFQPLLYQVATAGLEPSSISFPFRAIFAGRKNFFIRLCKALSVDRANNTLITSIGDIRYDYLVIATGCTTNFFGNEDLEENTMGLKSAAEALFCRNHILQSLEKALATNDEEQRQKLLTFVIVGGGATGVELAGALAEMRKFVLKHDFPDLDLQQMRIILVDGKDRLLYSFKPESSKEAEDYLRRRNVELRQKTRVLGYKNAVLNLSDGDINTDNVFWTAGVVANSLGGFDKEQIGRGNRLLVNEFNQVAGCTNVFAIGDTALMVTDDWPQGHPQVAQPALQEASNLAANLIRMDQSEPLKAFKYHDRGSMATIGRNHAVVETKFLNFGGFAGWVVWLTVHLMNIVGVKNRFFIFCNWVWSYFTRNSTLRIIIKPVENKNRKTV